MLDTLKENWRRYLTSSLVTFVASFLLFAVPELLRDSFEWTAPTVVSVLLAATRLGVKAVWEIVRPMLADLLTK